MTWLRALPQMNTTDQLATEAADEIFATIHHLWSKTRQAEIATPIIKVAIEKATADTINYWQGVATQEWHLPTHAAHASEQIDEDFLEGRVPPDLRAVHASEKPKP